MKLGLSIGYSGAVLDIPVELVQRAEALGYDSVWTAEAYGSDAVTPLAFLAGKTQRIKLGTAIMQLAARTPANAAMSAATVDALAGGGRFIAGIGVSGPQIVEGWYGQPWGKPYWRIKDYVEIMRKVFRREAPVDARGTRDQPALYRGGRDGRRQATEVDPAHAARYPDLPRHRERGDGEADRRDRRWLAGAGLRAGLLPEYRPWLEEGFRRAGDGKGFGNFTIQASAHVEVGRDVGRAGPAEAGGGALRRRHGPPRQEFPQGHDDPPRLRGGRRPGAGALPGRAQGRGGRGGAGRMGGRQGAGRPARPDPPAVPRLEGLRGADALTVRSRQPEAIEVMAEAARLNRR